MPEWINDPRARLGNKTSVDVDGLMSDHTHVHDCGRWPVAVGQLDRDRYWRVSHLTDSLRFVPHDRGPNHTHEASQGVTGKLQIRRGFVCALPRSYLVQSKERLRTLTMTSHCRAGRGVFNSAPRLAALKYVVKLYKLQHLRMSARSQWLILCWPHHAILVLPCPDMAFLRPVTSTHSPHFHTEVYGSFRRAAQAIASLSLAVSWEKPSCWVEIKKVTA